MQVAVLMVSTAESKLKVIVELGNCIFCFSGIVFTCRKRTEDRAAAVTHSD
jgi:hypothetical protein